MLQRDRENWTVAEYLHAMRSGDVSAPARLDRCAKRLAAAKAKALRFSPHDAEDAAQQVCIIALLKNGDALSRVRRADVTLSAWAAGVLDHLLADLVKARTPTGAAAPGDRHTKRGAQRDRVAAERTARLGPAGCARLNELTPSRLHAFRLYLEGFSNSEISVRLGISLEATRQRIRSASAQLTAKARSSVRIRVAALLADGWTPQDSAQLSTLAALTKGRNYRQIAFERGETPERVRSRVRRALSAGTQGHRRISTASLPPVDRLHG